MITLVDVVKNGNRILGYNCLENQRIIFLPKEEVIDEILHNNCTNGRIQSYNGNTIVRILDKSDSYKKIPVIDLDKMPAIEPFRTATKTINPLYKF